jgi:hypothetical protein
MPPTDPDDPLDAALKIARAFDGHGIAYAIGGAIAYGLWAVPRATVDVDVWKGGHWFLSAEAIAVFKLLFFRARDLADLERLVALRSELDVTYVRLQIVSMMGESDERVAKWDEIVRTVR